MFWQELVEFQAGSLTFGCRVDLDHFLARRAGTNSWYCTGESPPKKVERQELPLHLETTCSRFITSTRRRTCSSAGPGRSQQLEIPPNLNNKRAACFSSSASFSMIAGISLGAEISMPARILLSVWFSLAAGILPSVCFSFAARILDPLVFHWPQGFCHPLDFYWPQAFVHIFQCLYFGLFFHIFIKCAPISQISVIISGL